MWTMAFSIALGIAMAKIFVMVLQGILDRLAMYASDASGALDRRRSPLADANPVAPSPAQL